MCGFGDAHGRPFRLLSVKLDLVVVYFRPHLLETWLPTRLSMEQLGECVPLASLLCAGTQWQGKLTIEAGKRSAQRPLSSVLSSTASGLSIQVGHVVVLMVSHYLTPVVACQPKHYR